MVTKQVFISWPGIHELFMENMENAGLYYILCIYTYIDIQCKYTMYICNGELPDVLMLLLFLAVLESGAPLSSPLEEALYKCSVWMNEWIYELSTDRSLYVLYQVLYRVAAFASRCFLSCFLSCLCDLFHPWSVWFCSASGASLSNEGSAPISTA